MTDVFNIICSEFICFNVVVLDTSMRKKKKPNKDQPAWCSSAESHERIKIDKPGFDLIKTFNCLVQVLKYLRSCKQAQVKEEVDSLLVSLKVVGTRNSFFVSVVSGQTVKHKETCS